MGKEGARLGVLDGISEIDIVYGCSGNLMEGSIAL